MIGLRHPGDSNPDRRPPEQRGAATDVRAASASDRRQAPARFDCESGRAVYATSRQFRCDRDELTSRLTPSKRVRGRCRTWSLAHAVPTETSDPRRSIALLLVAHGPGPASERRDNSARLESGRRARRRHCGDASETDAGHPLGWCSIGRRIRHIGRYRGVSDDDFGTHPVPICSELRKSPDQKPLISRENISAGGGTRTPDTRIMIPLL